MTDESEPDVDTDTSNDANARATASHGSILQDFDARAALESAPRVKVPIATVETPKDFPEVAAERSLFSGSSVVLVIATGIGGLALLVGAGAVFWLLGKNG